MIQKVDKNILRMLALKNITREKIMKKLLVRFLKYLTKNEEQAAIFQPELQQGREPDVETKKEAQETLKEENQPEDNVIPKIPIREVEKKPKKKASTAITKLSIDPRDIMESMGIPFLSLSKNRKAPIVYESPDGTTKVRISCHSEHYIASIYDWDIIQCIAGKIQEVINSKEYTPPRTIIIHRRELLCGEKIFHDLLLTMHIAELLGWKLKY